MKTILTEVTAYPIYNIGPYNMIVQWCHENFEPTQWELKLKPSKDKKKLVYVFKSKQDANRMAFKLRWC